MAESPTYTKEPWTDQASAPRPEPSQRTAALEVKTIETHAQPKTPPAADPGRVDTNETPPAAGTPGPAAEPGKLSPQVSALARKEAAIRKRELAAKAKESEIEARSAKLAKFEQMEEKLKSKDYSAVEGLVNYDEFTQYLLDKQKGTNPTDQAIKDLKNEVIGLRKSAEDNLKQQFDAAVNERKVAVTKLVASDPEFSSIKALKREDAVIQHILDTWEHDDIDLSVEQAAKEVEELLVEEAKTYTELPKLKTQPTGDEKKPLPPLKQPKTLTNSMTASGAQTPLKPLHLMSESERYAEARRRAEAKLEAQKAAKTA